MHSASHRTDSRLPVGLAYVATVSFLASRVTPSGAFWLAIAGGIALARAGSSSGLRAGYGVGIAAMLQTTALMGPTRFSGPLTQALTAPLLGWLHRRGAPLLVQLIACFGIRLTHYLVLAAFFVWVVLGGVDSFTGTYDALTGWLGFLPQGQRAALTATVLIYGATAVVYSSIQVAVYDRALRLWPDAPAAPTGRVTIEPPADRVGRFDARAVALAAVVMFGILLVVPTWPVLAAAAAWLVLATATSRPDPRPLPLGVVLTALLAVTAFGAASLADLGTDEAARRATRAALLVLVATWLRAAAGEQGLRDVFSAVLGRLRWLPAVGEARSLLDGLDSRGGVATSGRELVARLGGTGVRPLAITDALVGWVASEAAAVRESSVRAAVPAARRLRAGDMVLLGSAAMIALVALLA